MTEQADYWFRPKTHGYGAQPTNWKGWLATLAIGVIVLAIAGVFMAWPAMNGSGPRVEHIVAWVVLEVVAVIWFIRFCQRKTDGEWRWRWGKES